MNKAEHTAVRGYDGPVQHAGTHTHTHRLLHQLVSLTSYVLFKVSSLVHHIELEVHTETEFKFL